MPSFSATLLENRVLAPHTFVLHLAGCAPLRGWLPGQFVMLRGDWGRDPLLPRAFSIMSTYDRGEDVVAEILVKTIGRGTALFERATPGAVFTVLGALGTAFQAPAADRKHWLVAGGVGLAPLFAQAERAARDGHAAQVRLFFGGRTKSDLVLLDRLAAMGVAVDLATEDGSAGTRGYVTAALARALDETPAPPALMVCGPDPMLVAVARLARERKLACWLSLEENMACGIGVCLGCAVPCATRPYRYTCKDGPVMSLDELRGPYGPQVLP